MFKLEDFKDSIILEKIVEKLNKHLNKKKDEKVFTSIKELELLLDEKELRIQITFILSILAEKNVDYLTDSIIKKVESFLLTSELKLRLNSITIIGFAMIKDTKYIKDYLLQFVKFLGDDNLDIKENVHFFLQELIKLEPKLLCDYKDYIFETLSVEKNKNNIYSLLEIVGSCEIFYFSELFCFKQVLNAFSSFLTVEKDSLLYNKIIGLCKKLYSRFMNVDFNNEELSIISERVNKELIFNKINLTNQSNITLEGLYEKINKSPFKDKEIYFYVKNKQNNNIFFYEIEKEKLINFFNQRKRISSKSIKNYFNFIDSDFELNLVVKMLIKLKYIKGYFSELGYFYPYYYLSDEFDKSLKIEGYLDLSQYDYLPMELIKKIIKNISLSSNQVFLLGKNEISYYSLRKIQQEINSNAAKDNIIDLKYYRRILSEESFLKLIKSLPKEYLTRYRKGVMILTNLGLIKIKNEIETSKILGYFSISKISEKLNLDKILLIDVLDEYIDYRSGIFNIEKDVFYYSKFLNDKIEKINQLSETKEKEDQIRKLTNELNIQENLILAKIDENLKLIGEEIKNQEQINISEYLEKTGMNEPTFFNFIDELGLRYLKKGNLLIFKENKIKEVESEIRKDLIDKSIIQDYILLGDLDITSSLVEGLLLEMLNNKKIKGVFYKENNELKFYTQKGIEKLMLQANYFFSFHDLFYGKTLSEKEIDFLRSILDNLLKKKKLSGTFDEEALTFSSYEVLFAQDYNIVLSEFEKIVIHYCNLFNLEFQKIKKILTKKDSTIFPKEIQAIQESIDRINDEYVRWRNELEAFIRRANIELLKKQGYTLRKYNLMRVSTEKNENVKLFELDSEVQDYLNQFRSWIKIFNEIELKYGNIIFYQKRLINNPQNKENKNKLESLLTQLKLV